MSVEVQYCTSVNGALSLHIMERDWRVIESGGGYLLNEVSWVVKPDYFVHFERRWDDLS